MTTSKTRPTASAKAPSTKKAAAAATAQESEFEASVKGIGQGIAGKFKEMLGEFIEDPNLEEEGIVQQLDGQIRRAKAEHPPSPKEDPTHEV